MAHQFSDGYAGKFNIPLNPTKGLYKMTVRFASPVNSLKVYHGLYTPEDEKGVQEFIIQNQHEVSSAIDNEKPFESKLNLFFKVHFNDTENGMDVNYIRAGRFQCGNSGN